MDDLGQKLSLLSFGIIGVIALIGVIQGKKLLDMFQIGVRKKLGEGGGGGSNQRHHDQHVESH